MTDKILHFIRHGEGEHNVGRRYNLRDPILTPLGESQCHELSTLSTDTFQRTADLLVCSIMRRTLQTMLLGVPALHARLRAADKPPVILDILQEVNPWPCNAPTFPKEDITKHEDPRVAEMLAVLEDDVQAMEVEEGYADKTGLFSMDRQGERAQRCRRWLFEREEKETVVVGHLGMLALIAFGDPDIEKWDNCQDRMFTFESDDMSKPLKEIFPDGTDGHEKVEPVNATEGPAAVA